MDSNGFIVYFVMTRFTEYNKIVVYVFMKVVDEAFIISGTLKVDMMSVEIFGGVAYTAFGYEDGAIIF